MLKGPKTLIAEGLTAVLDEFFEVDADAIEANLLGDTQVALRNTKLRPWTNELIKSDRQIVTSLTTGVVEEVLFTWDWTLFGQDHLVKNANLSIRGLRFKTQLSSSSVEEQRKVGVERTDSGRRVTQERRRSSLAEIKQEGLVEKYIRLQVEHIIDALTLSVEDFEFRLELPPDESGQVSGVSASGNRVSLMSVGGDLGGEERLRHRASFINGGLRQQLSFGCICFDIFTSTETLPLLEPLSYQLSVTRFTGERFSGLTSGLKVVGSPVYSSRHNIEDKDVVVHAGLTQILVLIELGNLILEKKRNEDGNSSPEALVMNRDETNLSLSKSNLDTLFEEGDDEEEVEEQEQGVEVWYPSLSEEEWKEVEQDYSGDEAVEPMDNGSHEKGDDEVYETLKYDVMKSSIFELPVSGVSVVLPNDARLTLEALRINCRTDGTVMNLEGDHGAGILIDGFQLEESCVGNPPNYRAAQIRWTPRKLDLLIKGWAKLMECIDTRLNLEKQPDIEFSGALCNGISVSFATGMNL